MNKRYYQNTTISLVEGATAMAKELVTTDSNHDRIIGINIIPISNMDSNEVRVGLNDGSQDVIDPVHTDQIQSGQYVKASERFLPINVAAKGKKVSIVYEPVAAIAAGGCSFDVVFVYENDQE